MLAILATLRESASHLSSYLKEGVSGVMIAARGDGAKPFDLILVGVNFEQGAQAWDCLAE